MIESDSDLSLAMKLSVTGASVRGRFASVMELLASLEATLGPLKLSLGEDEAPGPRVSSHLARAFLDSPIGFMAIGKAASFDVAKDRPRGGGPADAVNITGSFGPLDPLELSDLVRRLEQWGPSAEVVCARLGDEEEARRHLYCRLSLPGGSASSYLGRDHRQVCSGLFWWNLWSLQWLDRLGVKLGQLPRSWSTRWVPASDGTHAVVEGDFRPDAWADHYTEASDWGARQSGVFSMAEVQDSIPESLSELEAVRFFARWK